MKILVTGAARFIKDYEYSPSTDIKSGIISFVEWFKSYKPISKR